MRNSAGAERSAVTRLTVLDTIRSHLAVRDVDPAHIVEDARFGTDIDVDSLALQTLAQELEDEFGITIGERDAVRLETVGQTVDFVVAAVDAGRRT
jgi:acyl carrier protein